VVFVLRLKCGEKAANLVFDILVRGQCLRDFITEQFAIAAPHTTGGHACRRFSLPEFRSDIGEPYLRIVAAQEGLADNFSDRAD